MSSVLVGKKETHMRTYKDMIREEDLAQLVANWREQEPLKGTRQEKDFTPVVKIFNPCGSGTWIFTECEPDSSLAFGLCDIGHGTPELGYCDLDELANIKLMAGLSMEQDLYWTPKKTLSEYASEASNLGYIKA